MVSNKVLKEEASPYSPKSFTTPYVTEDSWEEILTRLPLDAVHRFKCVSKSFLATISHPSFIRRYIDHHRAKFPPPSVEHYLYYWFWHRGNDLGEGGFLELKLPNENPLPQIFSSPNGLLGRGCDYNFDYLPLMRDALQDNHRLQLFQLSSDSHGLALFRVELKSKSATPWLYSGCPRTFYVCNPLTKQWVELPPLPESDFEDPGPVALVCHPKSDSVNEVDFMVLEIEGDYRIHGLGFFYAHFFSSVTGCWSLHKVECHVDLEWYSHDQLVFCNGIFYWIGAAYIVAYDPIDSPNKCSFINMPPDTVHTDRQFYHCQGKLLLGSYYMQRCLVWELTDFKGTWKLIYDFPSSYYCVAFFSEISKDIVFLEHYATRELVRYNMKSHCKELVIAFPYDPDNPPTDVRYHKFSLAEWPTLVPRLPPLDVQDEY